MSKSLFAAAATRGGWATAALLVTAAAYAQSGTVGRAINEQVATEQAAQQTQQTIDKLDNETRSAVGEYRAVLQETESLKRYNEQLAQQLKSQVDEMGRMQQQLKDIETTSREIVPLLQKMLDTLDQFVQLDVPFLADERSKRILSLKEMMARADVSIAEKYRRIVEAYQIEMEYGRTIEAYEGRVDDRTMQFLRVGRVALLYQTLDGKSVGYWDAEAKAWKEDNSYRSALRRAIKVAKKEGAPDLITVPVAAPKEAN
ncbi:MAG TPA: DUF3450 domain-containing protein [Solimonas sp.]